MNVEPVATSSQCVITSPWGTSEITRHQCAQLLPAEHCECERRTEEENYQQCETQKDHEIFASSLRAADCELDNV